MDSLKCSAIPQRVVLSVMIFFGTIVITTMRSCLSFAITEMVVPINNTAKSNGSIICPVDSLPLNNSTVTEIHETRYHWTQEQQGWIFSAFSVGYFITHIPGATASQKFGGKWTLSLSTLAIIICTAATPLAVKYGELTALLILLVLKGLAAGSSFPAISVLLAAWVPEKERGFLGVFVLGANQVGGLLSGYVSGIILSYWSWPMTFYFWSVVAAIWFILFTLICYNDPASHPRISKEELDYLKREMGQIKRRKDLPPTPWTAIFRSKPALALIISQVCGDWVMSILSSNLPKYFKEVLGFSIASVGFYSSLPYPLKWIVSILSGVFSDYGIRHKYITITNARKINAAICCIFPPVFTLAASYAGCDRVLVILFFTLATASTGTYYSSLRVNVLDLSPNYSGSLMALANGLGALAGVVAPTFAGIMTPDATLQQYRFVFWVSFGIYVFRTIIYTLWASGEVQPWNEPDNVDAPESHKLNKNDDDSMEKDQCEDTTIINSKPQNENSKPTKN